jgi:ABC-type glycerol-3-phosphate transport system substrate-binding protein
LLDALQTEFGEKICVVLDNNFVSSAKEALETVEHTFGGHPQLANIMFNTIQPYIQQAFQEKITPEEAAEEAAADVRELL